MPINATVDLYYSCLHSILPPGKPFDSIRLSIPLYHNLVPSQIRDAPPGRHRPKHVELLSPILVGVSDEPDNTVEERSRVRVRTPPAQFVARQQICGEQRLQRRNGVTGMLIERSRGSGSDYINGDPGEFM